ncbi:hypothetical protein [Nesterenkonia massiliensis]|uniref:hypothetical protein n=1 Tax=Nesterenkonia massiliensis TaxID=1232429 RepID=UPI000427544E|nr:hypothetical protein [Nesterenkonia massiliensis]
MPAGSVAEEFAARPGSAGTKGTDEGASLGPPAVALLRRRRTGVIAERDSLFMSTRITHRTDAASTPATGL